MFVFFFFFFKDWMCRREHGWTEIETKKRNRKQIYLYINLKISQNRRKKKWEDYWQIKSQVEKKQFFLHRWQQASKYRIKRNRSKGEGSGTFFHNTKTLFIHSRRESALQEKKKNKNGLYLPIHSYLLENSSKQLETEKKKNNGKQKKKRKSQILSINKLREGTKRKKKLSLADWKQIRTLRVNRQVQL